MKTANFQAKAEGDALELMIYDAIGPDWAGMVSAKAVAKALNEHKDASEVTVRINSPGGDAFDGIAIHNALKAHGGRVKTVAEGLAASAASVIFMAGDDREMHSSAMLMIHDASGLTMGNEATHRKTAKTLSTLDGSIATTYANAINGDAGAVRELMDEETWFDADEAVNEGFATATVGGEAPSAHFDLTNFTNVPREVAERFGRGSTTPTETEHDNMTPDQFRAKHEDAVNDWINEGELAGYANCKQDLAAMIEACGGNVTEGYQAFKAKKSLADARAEHNKAVADELTETRAKLEAAEKRAAELENGADPLATDPSAKIEPQTEPSEEDKAKSSVQSRAAKIKNEYARNAFIASCGYDPKDFNFED